MNRKLRLALALLISSLPGKPIRRALYSLLPGIQIARDASIGHRVLIAVDRFTCGSGVTIRRGTSFVGPIEVELGDGTFIGRANRIECGDAAADPSQAGMNYRRRFVTGRNCLINDSHLIDVLGLVSIGDGSWLAGFASQFLTHGAGTMNRDIHIGRDCFLGSAVRFAPGSGVADRTIVALGSVVTKSFTETDVVIGGVPARVIKAREGDGDYTFQKIW